MRPQSTMPQKLRIDDLLTFEPITAAQETVYKSWDEGNHIVMAGSAGTGKTFSALYLALEQALDKGNPAIERVVVVRSIVPTREIGFLPGSIEEKVDAYTGPYRAICSELFDDSLAYDQLTKQTLIELHSTSFLLGLTFTDSVLAVSEIQNLTSPEMDFIITRTGHNCQSLFYGS